MTHSTKAPRNDTAWMPWEGPSAAAFGGGRPWVQRARIQAFRLLLTLGTVALAFLVVRAGALRAFVSWPDLFNALFFALLLATSFFRPGWLNALTWLGMVSLLVNAVDGMDFYSTDAVTGAHLLLPLLILYAALLGDFYMSLTALAGVLGIYTATWLVQDPLTHAETILLTNLVVVTIVSGVAALGVWLRHSHLEKTLDRQADALRTELETRLKVQALVTHDIRTPLTALVNAAMLDDPHVVQEMAGRISQIVDSAQGLTKGSDILSSSVAIGDIWKYSRETFSARLSEKGQTLETSGDSGLEVEADLAVLCNSILGNFLSNAIKFSPRGATIRMTAESAGDKVRVAVFDEGPGFPEDLLEQGPGSPRRQSIVGTEGEPGSGYGLQIAALCAARMNGSLEIRGKGPGGAISVLLPRPLDAR